MHLTRIIELWQNGENLADYDSLVPDDLGTRVVEGWNEDVESRRPWEERNAEALKLAMQVFESRTWPWDNASNVKYPLVTTACVQYNARAYPALVPGDNVVRIKTPDNALHNDLESDMNWSLTGESDEWEEEHDRLLMMQPLLGTVFKKTYYDPFIYRNRSPVISPENFALDYYAKSVETAERKTHRLSFSRNELEEQFRFGFFREVDPERDWMDILALPDEKVKGSAFKEASDTAHGIKSPSESKSYAVLEQHCWIDLDDDGYNEPYVVWVLERSREVLRITPRFKKIWLADMVDVEPGQYVSGKVAKIESIEYFTKYGFIPSPDGSIYDIGLGTILCPNNKAVNSILNQLIDAGTLANVQGGLLARNVRVRSGKIHVVPGKWHRTDADAETLQKGVFPWPIKEPSIVLFQLLGMLIEAGQKIGSVSETMMGQNPGQNQAASTTLAVLEQGLQVFSAIYKRTYRAMKSEFKKWYELRKEFSDRQELYALDTKAVGLVADPNVISTSQRLMKAEAVLSRTMTVPHMYGMEGAVEAELRFLNALQVESPEKLLNPSAPSNPEAELEQQKVADESKREWTRLQLDAQRTMSNVEQDKASVITKLAKARNDEDRLILDAVKAALDSEHKSVQEVLSAVQSARMEGVESKSGNSKPN